MSYKKNIIKFDADYQGLTIVKKNKCIGGYDVGLCPIRKSKYPEIHSKYHYFLIIEDREDEGHFLAIAMTHNEKSKKILSTNHLKLSRDLVYPINESYDPNKSIVLCDKICVVQKKDKTVRHSNYKIEGQVTEETYKDIIKEINLLIE